VDELGSFETLAQIALGIAGFSGVVVAVSDRPAHDVRPDSLRILSLLLVSLGAGLPTSRAASVTNPATPCFRFPSLCRWV